MSELSLNDLITMGYSQIKSKNNKEIKNILGKNVEKIVKKRRKRKNKRESVKPSNSEGELIQRIQPSESMSIEMTKAVVNDYTSYVSSISDSNKPIINVLKSRENMKSNIIQTLKTLIIEPNSNPEENISDAKIITELMKRNADDKKKIVAKVVKSIINDDCEVLMDRDFLNNPFVQNLSIIDKIMNSNKGIKGFDNNNFTSYNSPELSTTYISSQMREVNPENKYEHYCIKSHMKRTALGNLDTEINNNMVKNECYSFKTFDITLKSLTFPLEKYETAAHRKCVVCFFEEYTRLFIVNSQFGTHNFNLIQEFTVRVGQLDGYKTENIISQSDIPLLSGPMKFHRKTDYIIDRKKVPLKNGLYLRGLVESSNIIFH